MDQFFVWIKYFGQIDFKTDFDNWHVPLGTPYISI